MKSLALRYQRARTPLILGLLAAMLASVAWNGYTWPTTVLIIALVAAILLGVVARRITPENKSS